LDVSNQLFVQKFFLFRCFSRSLLKEHQSVSSDIDTGRMEKFHRQGVQKNSLEYAGEPRNHGVFLEFLEAFSSGNRAENPFATGITPVAAAARRIRLE
jgi:hypothetical protein